MGRRVTYSPLLSLLLLVLHPSHRLRRAHLVSCVVCRRQLLLDPRQGISSDSQKGEVELQTKKVRNRGQPPSADG